MPDGSSFTQEDIDLLLANIDHLSEAELAELNELVSELEERQNVARIRDDLIAFCCHMQADYKVGNHHRRLATLLEDIEAQRKDRICVSVPPRHGKSQMVSIYYAAWYLGRNPDHKIMLVSHTTDLAVDFGRKVRNLINTPEYQEIFPNVQLAKDSKSAGRWNTSLGGEFFAAGVGSALAGRGAHLLLVDDPHSEQDVLSGNFEVFEKAYEWFTYGARTRLMPGGAVAIVHCMTGDTGVLRPDGTETPLRDIRPGDMIASYEDGRLVSKKVLNWTNQGPDAVFTIHLSDNKLVRANARHPFLVDKDGVRSWVKVQDLSPGDTLVSTNVGAWGRLNPNQAFVTGVSKQRPVSKTGYLLEKTTEMLEKLAVRVGVQSPLFARGCAGRTTTLSTGRCTKSLWTQSNSGITTSSANTESVWPSTKPCWSSRPTAAVYAGNIKTSLAYQSGLETVRLSWLTTAMLLEKCVNFFVTAATSWCRKASLPSSCSGLFSTSKITRVEADGVEDVFDIQVEDTENFIANGVVSHNTRWHQDDLIGRVVRDMTKNQESDQYEVFEFPAIFETEDKTTGEIVEKALWPEFFDLPALRRTKASMAPFQWNAQYQQKPTAEEAAIIKREWWRLWHRDDPPPCEYIIMSLDAAAETHNRADFTALTTWGVFLNEEEDAHQLILLNSIKKRLEFPELKRLCVEEYNMWEPDSFIVEKKSAGVAIYQEMRRVGIPVQEYTPHRGTGDKMARLNSVSDIIASGMVWVPEHRWAEELVEEIAGFPFMSHDDLVDSSVMALMRFRQGGFIRLPDDWEDDPLPYRGKREYY